MQQKDGNPRYVEVGREDRNKIEEVERRRKWSPGIPGVPVAVDDGKSFTVVVKARSVESGVEAQNSVGSAKCRQGGARRQALRQESIYQE